MLRAEGEDPRGRDNIRRVEREERKFLTLSS